MKKARLELLIIVVYLHSLCYKGVPTYYGKVDNVYRTSHKHILAIDIVALACNTFLHEI